MTTARGNSEQPLDFAALNALLRAELGRQLVVAIAIPAAASYRASELASELARYPELRVLTLAEGEAVPGGERDTAHDLVAQAAGCDADALLVWADARDADDQERWPRQMLYECEGVGLCDRAFLALIGPQMTRASARKQGYEDGFTDDTPLATLATLLAREAMAREEARRRGSSPPCYL